MSEIRPMSKFNFWHILFVILLCRVSNSFINDECTEPSTSGTSPDDQMDTQLLRNCRGASLGAVGSLRYVDDYEILETLGKGFFGVVYKVV